MIRAMFSCGQKMRIFIAAILLWRCRGDKCCNVTVSFSASELSLRVAYAGANREEVSIGLPLLATK